MSERIISYADLSIINNALRTIQNNTESIYGELDNINDKQNLLEDELAKLSEYFDKFVKADLMHKSLQIAETRQGNLKQDLEIKFGYYAEVRRMATGILQGVDTGVVSDDVLKFTSEEIMIKAPGYWLAPTLVALSSWIRNDRDTCEKALEESLRRDDYKTTLFFMLVMRRLKRNDACFNWVERYFLHQNPHQLDREFIIILESITTGAFPPKSRKILLDNIKGWIEQLAQNDDYINQQKSLWINFFKNKGYANDDYPLLSQFSSNWDKLETTLKDVNSHSVIKDHFKNIIESPSMSKSTKIKLDEILSLLVTNFDDDELPLRHKIRLNELIIEMDGDKDAAQKLMDMEKYIFDEKLNFLQMLTNAAFSSELLNISKSTQALAISISQPWILEAHDTFTANCRNNIPQNIDLEIDGFKTSTTDGKDENKLVTNLEEHWNTILAQKLSALSFPFISVIVTIIVILICFVITPFIGLFGLVGGIIAIYRSIKNHKKQKENIIKDIGNRKEKSKEILRGCLAEIVDYRHEIDRKDKDAELLREYISTINPESFSSISMDTPRNII